MVGVERIDLNCGDSDTAATLCQSMTYYSDISSPLIDFNSWSIYFSRLSEED